MPRQTSRPHPILPLIGSLVYRPHPILPLIGEGKSKSSGKRTINLFKSPYEGYLVGVSSL